MREGIKQVQLDSPQRTLFTANLWLSIEAERGHKHPEKVVPEGNRGGESYGVHFDCVPVLLSPYACMPLPAGRVDVPLHSRTSAQS